MATSKELTAKVRIDASQAHKSLDKLITKINKINAAVGKSSGSNALEKKIQKAAMEQEKLKQATLKTQLAEERLTTQKNKSAIAAEKVNEATVKTQIAEQRLTAATERTKATVDKINAAKDKVANKVTTIKSRVQGWLSKQLQVNSSVKSTNTLLSATASKLKAIAGTYLGIMGTKAVIDTTDILVGAKNRLNYVSANTLGESGFNADGTYSQKTLNMTQDALDKMYVSSQKVRASYTDMMGQVSKNMTLAGNAFGNNIDNAIRFQEIMYEAYSVGGASAQEMSSSMYQLTQALGAGTLAGDELRSVREGAPLAYQAIEEFAQGVYNTEESLKDLGSQGKITSDMVVAAIMNSGNAMDKAFAQTKVQFGQVWDQILNAAKYAFQPIMEMLSSTLQKAVDNGMIQKFETFFSVVANFVIKVFTVISNCVKWIADNWSWLKNVVIYGLLLIASYYVVMTSIAVAQAVIRFALWLSEYWYIALIIVAMATLIFIFYKWKRGAIDTCTAISYALIALGVIALIVGVIMGAAWLLVLALALMVIAAIIMNFSEACGIIAGLVMWLGAVIIDAILIVWNFIVLIVNLIIGIVSWCGATAYNIFAGCVNAILQIVWSAVSPFISIIEFILNVCNGGFNTFGDAVANLIGQIIGWFLSLGKIVTKIIDAIFGTDWTGGLSNLQTSVENWGKNEKGITLDKEAPALQRIDATDAFSTGYNTFNYANLVNPMDSWETGYNAGYEWGSGIEDKVNQWGSQYQKGGSLEDKIKSMTQSMGAIGKDLGKSLGVDLGDIPGAGGSGFPDASDPKNSVKDSYRMPSNDELLAGVDSIKDNVGSIADSMDLTNDDLEYLRDIANMEWRKEFTTATIKVDMSNYNTINSERDLDGIVSYLSDTLREEMTSVAYGVHY